MAEVVVLKADRLSGLCKPLGVQLKQLTKWPRCGHGGINTVLRPLSSVRQTVHDWGGTLLEYLVASPDLDRVGLYCSRQHYCRAVSSVTRRVSWRDDSIKPLTGAVTAYLAMTALSSKSCESGISCDSLSGGPVWLKNSNE